MGKARCRHFSRHCTLRSTVSDRIQCLVITVCLFWGLGLRVRWVLSVERVKHWLLVQVKAFVQAER
jgi:hypothetical protein